MKAMILAAGLGTRLKPFTDKHPKALAEINGYTLLELSIKKLQHAGIFDVVVNVHHFADQIIEKLNKHNGFGSRYEISDETNNVLETGGGVAHAAPFLKNESDFLVMNVDIISNINLNNLINFHKNANAMATLAIQQRPSSRQLLFDALINTPYLKGWMHNQTQEIKPAHLNIEGLQPYSFSGIQVMRASVFNHIAPLQGKFSLIDWYLQLCQEHTITGWDHTGDTMLDVGKPEALTSATNLIQAIL